MNFEKIKELLKNRKVVITSVVALSVMIAGIGLVYANNVQAKELADKKVVASIEKEDKNKDKDKLTLLAENKEQEDKKDEEVNTPSNENIESEKKEDVEPTKEETKSNDNSSNKDTSSKQNTSNTTSSSNTSSKPNASSNKPTAPSHTHSWNPVTTTINHPEEGHYEDVVVKEAWTEEVPVFEEREVMICNDCGAELNASNCYEHVEEHLINGGKGSWREEWKQVQVGTNTVNHPAVTEKKWIVDKAAWTETVTTGYSCSCGATK